MATRNSDYALLTELQALIGGAVPTDLNTLAKLATVLGAQRGRLDALFAGSAAEVDTFLEVLNRFLSDESAASALNAALAALAARVLVLEQAAATTFGLGLQKVGPLVSLQQPVLPLALDAGQQGANLDTSTGVVTQTQFPTSTVSGFLAVSPGATYTASRKIDRYAYYSANQTFLGGGVNATVLGTPATAAFLRVQLPFDTYASTTFPAAPLPYVARVNGQLPGPDGNVVVSTGTTAPTAAQVAALTDPASTAAPTLTAQGLLYQGITQNTAGFYTPLTSEEIALFGSNPLSIYQALSVLAHQLAGTGGGGGTPAPFSATVDGQRALTTTPATGAAVTDYEYQVRPAAAVSATRTLDLTSLLAAGEAPTDYEYQFRS